MRTVPVKNVFDKVVRLHGLSPYKELPPNLSYAIIERINDRVREIWNAWSWPEWRVTEQRAFRQVWRDDHQYLQVSIGGLPDEVFYLVDLKYYKVNSNLSEDPPIGTLPTNTFYFTEIQPVQSYIAYDQGCRRPIGQVIGVYQRNPSGCNGSSPGLLQFHPGEKGIEVCNPGGPTAYISYRMPVPKFSIEPYVDGRDYPKASLVIDPASGECFQALIATENGPDTTDWGRVPFLEVWEQFVAYGAFADTLAEADQAGNGDAQVRQLMSARAEDRALQALQNEIDSLTVQGESLTWSSCRRRGYWCESQPWQGGDVTEISDACDTGFWVYPDPPPQTGSGGSGGFPPGFDVDDLFYLSEPNVALDVNTIPGIRHETRVASTDLTLSVVDFHISEDATVAQKTITLPKALGSGQIYHITKRDASANEVIIEAQSGEFIDNATETALSVQGANIALIDAEVGVWTKWGSGAGLTVPVEDIALKSAVNEFLNENIFTGIRLAASIVTEDYNLTANDFSKAANAGGGAITIGLPPATGSGKLYRVKKIDSSEEPVTVQAQPGDTIDGSASVAFFTQHAGALLQDISSGLWDNIGSVVEEPGLDLPALLYHPEITNDTLLEAFTTLGLVLTSAITVYYPPGGLRTYMLLPGAADGGDPGQVAPDDYHATLNNVHWEQK